MDYSTTRLNDAQAKLEESGYVDLKFFFPLGLEQCAKSDVQNSLAAMLEGFLKKEYKVSSFDDKSLLTGAQLG